MESDNRSIANVLLAKQVKQELDLEKSKMVAQWYLMAKANMNHNQFVEAVLNKTLPKYKMFGRSFYFYKEEFDSWIINKDCSRSAAN